LRQIPASVRSHLQQGRDGNLAETPKPGAKCFKDAYSFIVGSNLQAAKAAVAEANALGYHSLLLTTFVEGEAREVAKVASALAKSLCIQGTPLSPPACLVWGGETTVTVVGDGKGGRNQELALSAALEVDGWEGLAVMALATDGTDGPTNAGGAIINGTTVSRARSLGLDPGQSLSNNDAYTLLDAVNALIMTGPTGTNVNDLLVILVDKNASKPTE
jgi:hydroxypyruvate reductase